MGLFMAWNEGCADMILECNSCVTVTLIQQPVLILHSLYNLINNCKEAIKRYWDVKSLVSIYREKNVSVDYIINLGHAIGVHAFVSHPTTATNLLVSDIINGALRKAGQHFSDQKRKNKKEGSLASSGF